MTITPVTWWRELARGLAADIVDSGGLRDPLLRAAVEHTPRHVFVPVFHTQRNGQWVRTDRTSPRWHEDVYADRPLITAVEDGQVLSSSTKPGLMVRMIEAVAPRRGDRLLEIGTGTGYNVALLSALLGPGQVYSVDVDPGLVDAARHRLVELGIRPTVEAADGAGGLPEHAPFDTVLATCSVPRVPWAWAEQLVPGGRLLVDVKRSTHAGSLVLLRRHDDRLEGRFLPRWAAFMTMRSTTMPTLASDPDADAAPPTRGSSSTRLPPEPWEMLVPWWLAHATLPAGMRFGYRGLVDGRPARAVHHAPDGSWATVSTAGDDEQRTVEQGGPTPIWDIVEEAHARWVDLGKPGWERFGLTVLADGAHRVWLDEPSGDVSWTLPSSPRGPRSR